MKPKVHCQVQPRQIVPPRSEQVPVSVPVREVQVEEEIENFLQALDSYPAHVAKHPRLTFQQHLCGIITACDLRLDARRAARLRRQ